MAVDKLVDSTQLDADLTSVANAIRTKGGTSADLAFPAGFVSAVQAIPTGGGGWTTEGLADGTEPNGRLVVDGVSTVMSYAFYGKNAITSVYCTATTVGGRAFAECKYLVTAVFPNMKGRHMYIANGCIRLEKADLFMGSGDITTNAFQGCSALDTLILRKTSGVVDLGNTNVFNGTPFASGGSGGTIYIPKALYDHLGDGTSLDYKAATNWSTFDGYGTITWAQIEGSVYETQYADGTPIT